MSDDASTPEVPEAREAPEAPGRTAGTRATAADAVRHPWAAPGSVPDGVEGPQYASPQEGGAPREDEPQSPSDKDEASADRTAPRDAARDRDRTEVPTAAQDLAVAEAPVVAHAPAAAEAPAVTQDPAAAEAPAVAEERARAEVPAAVRDVPPAEGLAPAQEQAVPRSLHDQQTVTSLPGVPPSAADGGTPGWASPFAPPAQPALASFPPPNPATLAAGPDPFAPPTAQDGAVPPPPIAPDGPGQVPYGYPGGYGYGYGYAAPGAAGHGGAPGSYGWPGTRPMENGTGVSAMVLGIVAAGGFCLWPAAIVTGVLAIIFGLVGRAKAVRGEASNPGQALAGIICGVAGLLLGIGLAVLVIVA
ncbi:hypothetical protein ACH4F6_29505 [Streptomyces sp. NPDC017936]|uniref:hypothetical protein n=1 Tax=Streptomyces sp. NPDC017936 TaxID=3365016 RepID=UPI003797EEA8